MMTINTLRRFSMHLGVFAILLTLFAQPALAQYENPLGDEVTTIPQFLALVLRGLSLLLIPLVILFIIYTGYLFVTAQGEETKIQKARTALYYTIIGAAVILGAQIMADILSETLTDLNTAP